ncbi:MAG: hypothetical protein MUO33_05765 [Sedimentisphaerales bacterium]|nr:hypothetical protein [Sedimentisphaerales bacterium]
MPATAKPLLRGASPSGYGSALRRDEYRRRLNAAGNFSNVSSTAPDKGGLCGKSTGLSNTQRAKFHSKVLIAPKRNRKNEIFFLFLLRQELGSKPLPQKTIFFAQNAQIRPIMAALIMVAGD